MSEEDFRDTPFALPAGDGTCGDLDPACVDAVFSEPHLDLGDGVADDQVVDSPGPGDGRWNWFGLAPEDDTE